MRGFIPAKIGPAWVAVEAAYVHEILGARPWVPIPHASPNVPGVLAWRGRAIAVFDLGRLFEGGEPLRPGLERPRNLIVEALGCTLAMPVDAVHEVRELEGSEVRQSHATRLPHSTMEIEFRNAVAAVVDVTSVIEGRAHGCGVGRPWRLTPCAWWSSVTAVSLGLCRPTTSSRSWTRHSGVVRRRSMWHGAGRMELPAGPREARDRAPARLPAWARGRQVLRGSARSWCERAPASAPCWSPHVSFRVMDRSRVTVPADSPRRPRRRDGCWYRLRRHRRPRELHRLRGANDRL